MPEHPLRNNNTDENEQYDDDENQSQGDEEVCY